MGASADADVQDVERRSREMPSNDLLGPYELEPSRAPAQSPCFNDLELVVVTNLGRWLDTAQG